MRTIQVSTAVFAAIWAARQEGEDGEDAILARVLRVPPAASAPTSPPPDAPPARRSRPHVEGFFDHRYGFKVDEGFEVFRVYKGQQFRAKATGWKWQLEADGQMYDSLAELSRAIGAESENAWAGWLCRNSEGQTVPVGMLRDENTVVKRKTKPIATIESLGL
jgi:hypothetical protein